MSGPVLSPDAIAALVDAAREGRLPEEKPALEYWDGVVLQKAVGKLDHGLVQRLLDHLFYLYSAEHGGKSLPEPTVYFSQRGYLQPDIAYWLPATPLGDRERLLPPTLAIEVRSPGESLRQQRQKCRWMRANGVPSFKVKLGSHKGNLAFQILDPLERPR